MKAILEFDLPEDQEAFTGAAKAHAFFRCLWDMDEYLREQDKYHENDEAGKLRGVFWGILNCHDVTLEEYK